MAPFADAVCLVHRDRLNAPSAELRKKLARYQSFWCDIEDSKRALIKSLHPRSQFGTVESGVDECRSHACRLHLVDLILH